LAAASLGLPIVGARGGGEALPIARKSACELVCNLPGDYARGHISGFLKGVLSVPHADGQPSPSA